MPLSHWEAIQWEEATDEHKSSESYDDDDDDNNDGGIDDDGWKIIDPAFNDTEQMRVHRAVPTSSPVPTATPVIPRDHSIVTIE